MDINMYNFDESIINFDNESAIKAYLESIPKLPLYTYVNEAILFLGEGIDSFINKVEKHQFLKIVDSNPLRFKYFLINQDGQMMGSVLFTLLTGDYQNLYHLIAIANSNNWEKSYRYCIKNYYPQIQPVFFKQTEIENSFMHLEMSLGGKYRIRVLDLTVKEIRNKFPQNNDNSYKNRKFIDTKRWWTDLSVQEVFDLSKEQELAISSLKFSIQKKDIRTNTYQKTSIGRISRTGVIHFNGSFNVINQFLLPRLEIESNARFNLFGNRGLRERRYSPSTPIQIMYDYDIFSEPNDVKRIGALFSKYPNSSRIEYHCNPYYHASLADFDDGSSFDIWILSTRKIIIIPQAKSSAPAFERITSYILDNLGEGAINEYIAE